MMSSPVFSSGEFMTALFDNNADFDDLAYRLFVFQQKKNDLYRRFTELLGVQAADVRQTKDIPFLPIGFFKTHEVKTGAFAPEVIFESSGTTGAATSRHLVKDASLYERSFTEGFERFYGPVSDYVIIGLLPAYLERRHSSLAYMVGNMIRRSGQPESGFYLYEHQALHTRLQQLEKARRKTLLIGVTFALLDFAERYRMQLQHTLVMETGGMKGRRQEWTRPEVHHYLEDRLGVSRVHSEYGMTELLSQAYSKGRGIFYPPLWMKVFLRDETDPLSVLPEPAAGTSRRGMINIIDLANVHSCGFIATDDIGRAYPDGGFEVLGRLDHSDLRGCSLMTA
ncbi:MAG TPA: acyl transferase [Chitinophagaceae bacterium]|nr:acyl transferase [Chitinophagaceae bacterium]